MDTQLNGATKPFDLANYQDAHVIQELLHRARTIAIVGRSHAAEHCRHID